jgi:hypothetical protein
MSANPLRFFPFHVEDYLSDPSVQAMDADAEGLYIRLLAESWRSPTPGRIPVGLVDRMSGSYRLAEQYRVVFRHDDTAPDPRMLSPEEIASRRLDEVADQLKAAFYVDEVAGVWVQKRMVLEYERIVGRREARQRGAEETNRKLYGNRDGNRDGNRIGIRGGHRTLRASGVGVDSTETEKAEETHLGNGKAEELESATGIPGLAEETVAQWREGFQWFYERYPRKRDRAEALKAYLKIRPRTQETFDLLMAGLDWYKSHEWQERAEDKIEYPSTWLNKRRWLDAQAVQ